MLYEVQRGDRFDLYVSDIESGRLENITSSAANEIDPDWSPDGRRIVFGSDRDGNQEIYVMSFDPLTFKADLASATRLTRNPGFDGEPVWSPDGTRIAYESERAGVFSVYTMLVSGEDQVKLTPDQGPEFDPAWSVDGRQVAYTAVRDSNAEVFVIEVGGFNPRNLTRHGANDFKPSWSRETR